MFDQHGSFVQERIDPDSGLLDKLLANKTLSKIEYDGIKVHHLFYERNARLLDYISQKKKHDSLIDALRDTHQTHLVNYLIGNEGTANSVLNLLSYIAPLTPSALELIAHNYMGNDSLMVLSSFMV